MRNTVFYKIYKDLFTLKIQKSITTYFDQCGHHQELKLLGEETAVFLLLLMLLICMSS
jgi:hypothetical protein